MKLLSEDDLDIATLDDAELERAWDLWFDLAQATNDDDPPYAHGVLVGLRGPIRDEAPPGAGWRAEPPAP